MNDLRPNSIEAVILFILYICIQDGRISEEESKELIITAPIIQKMYLHIFGEYIPFDLELMISDMLEELLKERDVESGKIVNKSWAIKPSTFVSGLLPLQASVYP